MYSIGSARLPSIEGIASLRQTRKLRRPTCAKRRLRTGGRKSFARIGFLALLSAVFQVHPSPFTFSLKLSPSGRVRSVSEKRLPDLPAGADSASRDDSAAWQSAARRGWYSRTRFRRYARHAWQVCRRARPPIPQRLQDRKSTRL